MLSILIYLFLLHILSLSITTTVAGLIIGAYGIVQLILRIPLGITLDIIKNHKLFIIIGSFLAGISSIGMLFFPSPVMLFISNTVSGMASTAWIAFTVLYPVYYENNQSARAIGILNAFQRFGILIAFAIGGLLYSRFGIRSLFIFSFISGMIRLYSSIFYLNRNLFFRRNNISICKLLIYRQQSLLLFSTLVIFIFSNFFGTVYSFSTSTASSSSHQMAALPFLQ